MMSNLLTHRLPEKSKYGHPIITDFSRWINFARIMSDQALSEKERIALALHCVYYKQTLEESNFDLGKAIDGAIDFFRGWLDHYKRGSVDLISSSKEKSAAADMQSPPVIDFDIDSGAIYASFASHYGIMLDRVELHFHAFMLMLSFLPQETPMGYRIYIRTCKVEGSDQQKKLIREAKRHYRIDGGGAFETPEEKIKRALKKKGGSIDG